MLKKGIIEESYSPWSSPVVLVTKKNGKTRFCVDYRKLNEITKKDNHPIPRIDDMLDKFQGSQWFTSIDLKSGYWNVMMDEKDKEKTAFITSEGLYQFNVMPFGLCNAPGTFQRLMHKVLGNLIYTMAPVYLDDINIHSQTFEQHLLDIQEVFDKLRNAKLKLGRDKCHFCKDEIEFLGYIVSKDGIKTDEKKIQKIRDFPRPNDVTQLRGFLGLAGYYRRFIRDYAKHCKPMNKLLAKDEPFVWGKEQQKSFDKIKQKLITSPVLIYPDFNKPFRLYTDASNIALGAVLQQKSDDDKEHPVAFLSRTLNKLEQKYHSTELECLAVKWAVEKLSHYLKGRKFTIISDYKNLKWWFNNFKDDKSRRARWRIFMQQYDFDVEYKKGVENKVADALSRARYE